MENKEGAAKTVSMEKKGGGFLKCKLCVCVFKVRRHHQEVEH
jgi:hypothetical protein